MYPRPEGYTPPNERSLGRAGHNLNTVFVGLVSAAGAGIAVWLFALGGIGMIKEWVEGAEFSSSPPWVTITSPEDSVARSALLTLADLPPGWALATDDDDDEDTDFGYSEECKQLEDQATSAGVLGSAGSEDMEGPEDQRLTSEAAVFEGGDSAQASLDRHREVFARCGADLVAAFEEGVRIGGEREGVPRDQLQIQTALEDLGSPNVGEGGVMYRISGTVTWAQGSFQFAVDFIAFRVGRMDAGLVYSSINGLRPEEEQQIVQLAAAKLQTANASLDA